MYKSVFALFGLALCALATDTRYWSLDAQQDFEKGHLKNVALRSDGRIALSPAVKEIADLSIPYLWSAALAPNGTLYTAGGPSSDKSAIYEIPRGGQSRKLAEIPGMNILALAVDKGGRLFAATSPDGKIYRVSLSGSVDMFYDPKAKYIWSMAFLPNGDLLAATGDQGQLHRISPNGAGKVWMKLDEDHIRSLTVDAKGTVYVGTEPGGLIVRADDAGNGFVVYQSSKREVTSLAVARDGAVYAAILGQKTTGSQMMIAMVQQNVAPPPQAQGQQGQQQQQRVNVAAPIVPAAVPGGSELVRVDPDGAPVRVWSHPNDLIYALALDSNDMPILGTGNKGSLYRVESPSQSTLLRSFSSTQVTALLKDGDRMLAVTGNVGKVYEMAAGLEAEGNFESEVFDGGAFSQWGRLHAKDELNGGTIRYETRSGNLDRPTQMWSPWAPLNDGRVASPPARFLQWRAVLKAGQTNSPALSQLDVAYLPKNVAPRVDIVEATPANYRFPAPAATIIPIASTLTLPPIGKSQTTVAQTQGDGSTSPLLTYARGMIGARWMAVDDNNDTLEFSLSIKGENEQTWKLLKDKIRERYFSFDATAFGDGKYQVRVLASDAPSNPLNQSLIATATSAPFLIDNTPPVIKDLSLTPSGARMQLRFRATDALSVVQKAEISINGGAWSPIDSTVRLTDSKDLEFIVPFDRPAPGEMTVAVRVTDEFDNQSVGKITAN